MEPMTRQEALSWLKKAQDLPPDDGISTYYDTRYNLWAPSYPETSGYIIRTFLRSGETERALRVARWLRSVQTSYGAITNGFFSSATPNAFDTAQVLRGWLWAYDVDPDPRTLESIDRAVGFLEDSWRLEKWGPGMQTYYIRNIEPLKIYGSSIVDEVTDFYLQRMEQSDWFKDVEDEDHPLTHFIAYIARGLLDIGLPEHPLRIAKTLEALQDPSGAIPARLSSLETPSCSWICVPAVAQMAIVWHKLGMMQAYTHAMRFVSSLSAPWASLGVDATYLPGRQVNWSAKFIVDAYAIAD